MFWPGIEPKGRLALPDRVAVVEVGLRDGLQNEPLTIPTAGKLALLQLLIQSGLRRFEITSFVHPALVPQLADAEEMAR